MTITTTLNRIRAHSPCAAGWAKLLRHLGKTEADDEPLPFSVIVTSNGLDDALWCCQAEPQHDREWRLFAVWCARQVQHLMTDPRSVAALDVAERYANGEATQDELTAAETTARTAAAQAAAEWAACPTTGAAWTAWAAAEAAWTAARAAWAVAATGTVAAAVTAAQIAAARSTAARDAQREKFLEIVKEN